MTPSFKAIGISCIRQRKLVFADVTFAMQPGSVLLITGSNGAGKSSLLRILAGLATPASGEIHWQGKKIDNHYWQQLHYLGHQNGVKLGLTVNENLQLTRVLAGKKQENNEAILRVLQLQDYQHVLVTNLSAGQKRRVALARLMVTPQKLWILDEPFTAIDETTQQLFLNQLALHTQRGGLAIISSHQQLSLSSPMMTLRLPC